ncbi:MAG: SpoIIE family protein phosphatase [Bacteroidia bacterium]|nr:SpoIIE family protein phosphatase [Bacteroidia bacterium]
MNLLNNDIIFLIIIAVTVLFFIFYQKTFIKRRFKKAAVKMAAEYQVIENTKKELETVRNALSKEKENLNVEKKKGEEKNRKTWQMSEAIYKEKAIIASENEKLLKEKEKLLKEKENLENEKKKFEVKNKKLWSQSIAIFKEKDKIEALKKDIEEKHHNVTESIRYAKRIQEAILPPSELMKNLLPDSFVLYKPKDIVSGDFYWIETSRVKKPESGKEKEIVLFSVVDCTGHGVPGAFMSIFGYNLLNQAIDEHNLTKPSEILDFLSHGVMKKLRLHSEEIIVTDGMDLMLCAYHRDEMKLEYAGVHNPLYLVRGEELIPFKADQHAIGDPYEDEFTGYSNYEIDLQKGDIIYIFSDGYCDQFGGPQRRKFMSKNLRDTLLGLKGLTMESQKAKLDLILNDWKGEIEQVDDITIMGIKI